MKQYLGERMIQDQIGRNYVFRDVFLNGKFAGCQYKTLRDDNVIVWKPCREGSEFSEVEPYQAKLVAA